ncbi:hypothetical protein D3C71_1424860 [compost metagenome]
MAIEQCRVGLAVVSDDKGIDILGCGQHLQDLGPGQRNSRRCSGHSSLHLCRCLAEFGGLDHHADRFQRSCAGEELLRAASRRVLRLRISLGLSVSQGFEYQAPQPRAFGLLLHAHRHARRALAAIGKGDQFATTARQLLRGAPF